jgi:hypothetical protein
MTNRIKELTRLTLTGKTYTEPRRVEFDKAYAGFDHRKIRLKTKKRYPEPKSRAIALLLLLNVVKKS